MLLVIGMTVFVSGYLPNIKPSWVGLCAKALPNETSQAQLWFQRTLMRIDVVILNSLL